jgi:hypothetical protein
MIEYDKERITDEKYIKSLLENKYIKTNINDTTVFTFIKYICICPSYMKGFYFLDYCEVQLEKDYKNISSSINTFFIPGIFDIYSFTTKEEFMNAYNKVM